MKSITKIALSNDSGTPTITVSASYLKLILFNLEESKNWKIMFLTSVWAHVGQELIQMLNVLVVIAGIYSYPAFAKFVRAFRTDNFASFGGQLVSSCAIILSSWPKMSVQFAEECGGKMAYSTIVDIVREIRDMHGDDEIVQLCRMVLLNI